MTDDNKPTDRQAEILAFIKANYQYYGPTVREIARQFGIRSPNGVICHLDALERKGLIRRVPNRYRGIELVEVPQ